MEAKRLSELITKNGFTYHLIKRTEISAIYEQKLDNIHIGYEVFKIKSHNGYEIAGNKIDPSEMFPSNEDFGVTAWHCKGVKRANEKYEEITKSK